MRSIIPADIRAIWACLGRDLGAAHLILKWWGAMLLKCWEVMVMLAIITAVPFAFEWLCTDDLGWIAGTFVSVTVVNALVFGHLEIVRSARSQWMLIRPISTFRLARALFIRPCGMALALLSVAHAAGVVSGLFERTVLHGQVTQLTLVLTPVAVGLEWYRLGTNRVSYFSTMVLIVGALAALARNCPLSIDVEVWRGLCILVSVMLGYGLSVRGVSRMRRGASSSGFRLKKRRARRMTLRTRARHAFASAETAEVWRQWRRAWFALPAGVVGMSLVSLPMVGVNMLIVRGLGVAPYGENGELLGGVAFFGCFCGAVIAGLLAVAGAQRALVLRLFSASALARSLFRGAAQAVGVTGLLLLGAVALWRILGMDDIAPRTTVVVMPFELALVVVYGLLAVWGAIWAVFLLNWVAICTVGTFVAFVLVAVFPAVVRAMMHGVKTLPTVLDVVPAAWCLGLLWVFAVTLPVYGARALYLAKQKGLVAGRACWGAVCIWFVLVAVPLVHCPVWLSQVDVSLRVALTLCVVTCAVVPIGAIPLLCDALKRPGVSLLGWRGYGYTPPIVRKLNEWSERQRQRRLEYD